MAADRIYSCPPSLCAPHASWKGGGGKKGDDRNHGTLGGKVLPGVMQETLRILQGSVEIAIMCLRLKP